MVIGDELKEKCYVVNLECNRIDILFECKWKRIEDDDDGFELL